MATKFEQLVKYIEGKRDIASADCRKVDTSTPEGKAKLKQLQHDYKLYNELVMTSQLCWDEEQ
jgi:hypothetical protein